MVVDQEQREIDVPENPHPPSCASYPCCYTRDESVHGEDSDTLRTHRVLRNCSAKGQLASQDSYTAYATSTEPEVPAITKNMSSPHIHIHLRHRAITCFHINLETYALIDR